MNITRQRIDGIWHTGVVIFGIEYFFGGGIQCLPYGTFSAQNNLPVQKLINVGTTNRTRSDLEQYLRSVRHLYSMHTYDLINNNCNNFSDAVVRYLTSETSNVGIPSYIVDLPRIAFSTPGGQMLRPMIEGMQNNIRNQTQGSLDPFGATNGGGSIEAHSSVTSSSYSSSPFAPSYSTPVTSAQQIQHVSSTTEAITSANFEQNLSDAVMSSIEQMISDNKGVHNDLIKLNEELVSSPILLSDAGNIKGLMEKIIGTLATGADNGISECEKNDLTQLVEIISALTVSRAASDLTPPAALNKFDTFFKLYFKDSTLQLSFLSLLRYIVLQPNLCHNSIPLQKVIASIVEELASPKGFKESTAIRTIAYSVLTNVSSHAAGAKPLIAPTYLEQEAIFAKAKSKLIDVVIEGLGHSKAAVKMMASALAVNLTIAATSSSSGDAASVGPFWSASNNSDQELHPSAVQLLCYIIESIESENNQIIRLRELIVLYRLLKHCDTKGLADDLGLDPLVSNLVRNAHHQHQVSQAAAAGAHEEAELRRDEAVLIREIHKLVRV